MPSQGYSTVLFSFHSLICDRSRFRKRKKKNLLHPLFLYFVYSLFFFLLFSFFLFFLPFSSFVWQHRRLISALIVLKSVYPQVFTRGIKWKQCYSFGVVFKRRSPMVLLLTCSSLRDFLRECYTTYTSINQPARTLAQRFRTHPSPSQLVLEPSNGPINMWTPQGLLNYILLLDTAFQEICNIYLGLQIVFDQINCPIYEDSVLIHYNPRIWFL